MSLSASQIRFIKLHQLHLVTEWRNVLGGAMLRARTDRGRTATVSVGELDDLTARGLVTAGHGIGIALTAAGKEWK